MDQDYVLEKPQPSKKKQTTTTTTTKKNTCTKTQ